jgi:hypothetical protein
MLSPYKVEGQLEDFERKLAYRQYIQSYKVYYIVSNRGQIEEAKKMFERKFYLSVVTERDLEGWATRLFTFITVCLVLIIAVWIAV